MEALANVLSQTMVRGIHLPATLGWTIELNIESNFICIYYINDS